MREYLLDRARAEQSVASASEQRSADGAVVEAEENLEAAVMARDAADADIARFDADAPFPPSIEATAHAAEATVAHLEAREAHEAALRASAAAEAGGCRGWRES